MEKYLNIPVTDEQSQLVPATGIVLIVQSGASGETTTITYKDGSTATLSHANGGSGDDSMSAAMQTEVAKALKTNWRKVSHDVVPPLAVSGIAFA